MLTPHAKSVLRLSPSELDVVKAERFMFLGAYLICMLFAFCTKLAKTPRLPRPHAVGREGTHINPHPGVVPSRFPALPGPVRQHHRVQHRWGYPETAYNGPCRIVANGFVPTPPLSPRAAQCSSHTGLCFSASHQCSPPYVSTLGMLFCPGLLLLDS